MFDELYSSMVKKADYRALMFVPPVIAILLLLLILVNGIPLGIDFRGGTWIEVSSNSEIPAGTLNSLESELISAGLENLKIQSGRETGTGIYKTYIETTTEVDEEAIRPILERSFGELSDIDSATVTLSGEIPFDLADNLRSRIPGVDVELDENSSVLRVSAIELDAEELESAIEYYLGYDVSMEFQSKNFNSRRVGATLGSRFRDQGLNALLYAYLLIILVVFVAFRDFIPSITVILAATLDGVIAAGGMALFGIILEPASLVAILMLVGYSVDTNILLTTRVLRGKFGTINERIDDAMKTGLTMSATTILVMAVILFVSSEVFRISTLSSIAAVLLIGLIGDLATTWLMNAGILKWYVEEKRGKLRLFRRGRR